MKSGLNDLQKVLLTVLLLLPGYVVAAGGETPYPLDEMQPDIRDQASLQRGAKTFINYCMGCHTLKYQRYQRTADDLGIPVDLMMEHMVFDPSVRIGSLMENALSVENAKQWFGSVPPDLTMYTMLKGGPEYLYTYMRVFYEDDKRPFGVNNLLFENVGMPHPLIELQGVQRKVCKQIPQLADNGGEKRDPLSGEPITEEKCGDDLVHRGFSPLELMRTTRVAIIGGGITGLAAAVWLERDHGIDDVLVVEAASAAGVKIRSKVDAGSTLEEGPQGFLDNAPDTLELASLVGLEDALVQADESAADRFILRGGRLRRVATSLIAFMMSDILPLTGRLRLLGEPFARKRPDHDETVLDFGAPADRTAGGRGAGRRHGDGGVCGRLEAALARRHLSENGCDGDRTRVIDPSSFCQDPRGETGREEERRPGGPGGRLTTFDGGMVRLPQSLSERLGDRLMLDSSALKLSRKTGDSW